MKNKLFLLFFSLVLGVAAQTSSPVEDSTKTFRLLALTPNPIIGLLYDLNGKPKPVNAFTGDISRVFTLPKTELIEFYVLVPSTDPAKPDPQKKIIARTSIVQPRGPLLIMLSMAPAGQPLPYVAQAMNISVETQPANTARFFNFSHFTIATQFKAQVFSIKAQETYQISYGSQSGEAAALDYAIYRNNDWEPVGQSLAYTPQNSRLMVLYFDALDSQGRPVGISCNVVKDGNPPLPTSPASSIITQR